MALPKIDVAILTKNSARYLRECLFSVRENLELCHLIVVDGGSTDGTIKIIQDYPNHFIISDIGGTRATARQKAIEAVDTEYFAFVDSDVILCDSWQRLVWEQLQTRERIGGLWGVAIPHPLVGLHRTYAGIARLLRESPLEMLAKRSGLRRFQLHDTLLRTEALRGIRIPPWLHVWEDHFIGMYVTQHGWSWITTTNPYCLHYVQETERDPVKEILLAGQANRILGWLSFPEVASKLGKSFAKGLWLSIIDRDIGAFASLTKAQVVFTKAWLFPGKVAKSRW